MKQYLRLGRQSRHTGEHHRDIGRNKTCDYHGAFINDREVRVSGSIVDASAITQITAMLNDELRHETTDPAENDHPLRNALLPNGSLHDPQNQQALGGTQVLEDSDVVVNFTATDQAGLEEVICYPDDVLIERTLGLPESLIHVM